MRVDAFLSAVGFSHVNFLPPAYFETVWRVVLYVYAYMHIYICWFDWIRLQLFCLGCFIYTLVFYMRTFYCPDHSSGCVDGSVLETQRRDESVQWNWERYLLAVQRQRLLRRWLCLFRLIVCVLRALHSLCPRVLRVCWKQHCVLRIVSCARTSVYGMLI